MAKMVGKPRRTLLNQLKGIQRYLPGQVIIQNGPRGRIWINRDLLTMLQKGPIESVVDRLNRMEHELRQAKERIDNLEHRMDRMVVP
jgi:hypothetical protein